MAKASDLIGGGSAFAPMGTNRAYGQGWVIDPDLNTTGINVSTLQVKMGHYSDKFYVGGDKATINNNLQWNANVEAGHLLTNFHLPPGIGLYVSESDGEMTVIYEPV